MKRNIPTMQNTKAELAAALTEALAGLKAADAETTKLTKLYQEASSKCNELDRERIQNLYKWMAEQDTNRHISTGAADIYSNLRDYEIQANLTLNALARLVEMCEVMHQADKTLKPHAELLLVMVRYAQECLFDARHEQREIRHSDETFKAIRQQLKWDDLYPKEEQP